MGATEFVKREAAMLDGTPKGAAKGRTRGFDKQLALESAMDMFWQHGYEGTSVSELCAGIGIKPPSLYAAFGSKAQLFLEVLEYYERTYWDPVWDAFERESHVMSAFTQLFADTVSVITAPGPHLGCLVTLSAASLVDRDSDVARALVAIGDDGLRRFEAKLDFGIRDGQISPKADTLALAHSASMIVDGLAMRAHDRMPPEMLRRLAAVGTDMIPVSD
ncbi:TetR/AcrR family transcriptional regulator [Rhodococcus sp. IEGM 1330]|uniref:TetR/AcrR family transcriptional regulator n=1 Tax=Rhodococcus sp. IEGM 1330 TaxID=3082225 RepID=UPI002954DC63|nr:TetR/AcrR family transcriptional regulator [Rhodococcus sp. IEGM 1330]MDV8022744.1 TetR/AcrR family transcriptional regulator [Rhodococcus sp. IEGM 1330]